MKYAHNNRSIILSIFPSTRGFGFAVLEGNRSLLDWGVKDVAGNKNAESLRKITELVTRYEPDAVVLEDYAGAGSRRAKRIAQLIDATEHLAVARKIKAHRYSRLAMRECFAQNGAITKYAVAQMIATRYAELAPHLPPPRKIWMSEDRRMALFDAMALALTFLHVEGAAAIAA